MKRILAIIAVLFVAAPVFAFAPVSCSITATPSTINRGDSTTISYTTSGGTKDVVVNTTHHSPASGSFVAFPTGSRPYLVSVVGTDGGFKQCSVWVTVQ